MGALMVRVCFGRSVALMKRSIQRKGLSPTCLLKKYTTLTNSQIGQLFENISYSAVTRVVQRFEQKIKKDKELKKRIESIKADLSNLKG